MLGSHREGGPHDTRGQGGTSYIPSINSGLDGGGTYTGNNMQPSLQQWENFLGPSGRDVKEDPMRDKRHQRIHLPQAYVGPNQYLTDRVDGLITDATNSPFTTKILPYKYQPYPDNKIKWNVWSFDEGMASRVPYESAARVLTQSMRKFAGFLVRQGMAIVLEHNFMMTEKGRTNFQNQLMQMVGSIQYTNDLDVHIALVQAPSYEKHIREKYYVEDKSNMQICREYVDLFGFMQKNNNALDILIEEAKARLKSWGGPMPDFLLCNSKLTFQLTMTPEKTNWVTNGYDGQKRLKTGPDIPSYRGVNVIHSRCFSMEGGTPPRDILKRRVRVAEYYRIPPNEQNINRDFQFYNEERDTWFTYSFLDLLKMAVIEDNAVSEDQNQVLIKRVIELGEQQLYLNNNSGASARAAAPFQQRPTQAVHLAAAPEMMEQASPYLGVSLEGASFPKAEIVKQVALVALRPSRLNWAPEGTFITEDCFVAFGAVSWNKFFRTAKGTTKYIPPPYYYFQGYEPYNDNAGLPFGYRDQRELKNFLMATDYKQFIEMAFGGFTDGAEEANKRMLYRKTELSMLFESICDYPRVIGDFSNVKIHNASEHMKTNLDSMFKHGSASSNQFQKSIRFRNWMRYGVSVGLCINSEEAIQTLLSGNAGDNPWNRDVFDLKSENGRAVFDTVQDDGLAILRKPGAFLAPNHFSRASGASTYDSFELFCGANIIFTKEFADEFFKCASGLSFDDRNFIMDGCRIYDILKHYESDTVKTFLSALKIVMNKVKEECDKNIPKNRIELTALFQNSGLLQCFQNLTDVDIGDGKTINYSTDHPNIDYVWTWPNETYTCQEIWCHDKDYRLYDDKGAVPDATDMKRLFPNYQVGQMAIENWKENISKSVQIAESTAPSEANPAEMAVADTKGNISLQSVSISKLENKKAHMNSWEFTSSLGAMPSQRNENVYNFLMQLLCRFMFDQSDSHLLKSKTDVADCYKLGFPNGPLQMRKQIEPRFVTAGGVYAGSIASIVSKRSQEQARVGGSLSMLKTPDSRAGGPRPSDQPLRVAPARMTNTRQDPPARVDMYGKRRDVGGPGGMDGGDGGGGMGGQDGYGADGGSSWLVGSIPVVPQIEIVIVRPNIEHQMLGIIMGQGGENLGATLWGQTELSCYDDSMHGIWGMSYKYHERAIVFNEKNLVRLWDVAYDGYTGGKDDTFMKWSEHEDFKDHTNNISTNYRGPSMMVMAFVHTPNTKDYADGFKRNWPSPIVFHDGFEYDAAGQDSNNPRTLSMDADNVRSVNINEFRVFNNPLYAGYKEYQRRMPDFTTLHTSRKPAGIGGVEGETFCEALAFQGTMKVINSLTRSEIEHIQGSGHHGPDWVGVASIRAGKGYKTGGPLTLQRMV